MSSKRKLSVRQQLFVDAYIATGNRAEAARRSGTPARSAWNEAYRMMRNDEVSAAIEERLKENGMSADEVISRLADHARGDLSDLYQVAKDGSIVWNFGSPEALRSKHLIKKIRDKTVRVVQGSGKDKTVTETRSVEVELHDAQAALFKLGEYHRLWTQKVELTERLTVENLEQMLEVAHGHTQK